jgi:hypothetical protein
MTLTLSRGCSIPGVILHGSDSGSDGERSKIDGSDRRSGASDGTLSKLSGGDAMELSKEVVEAAVLRKPSQLQKAKGTRMTKGRNV